LAYVGGVFLNGTTAAAKADPSVAASDRRPTSEDAASMLGRKSSTFMAIPCCHELKWILLTVGASKQEPIVDPLVLTFVAAAWLI
jgi:hypothetical protein